MPSTSHYPVILRDKLDEVKPWIIQNIHEICNEKNGLKTVRQLCRRPNQRHTPAGGQGRSQGWPQHPQESDGIEGKLLRKSDNQGLTSHFRCCQHGYTKRLKGVTWMPWAFSSFLFITWFPAHLRICAWSQLPGIYFLSSQQLWWQFSLSVQTDEQFSEYFSKPSRGN